MNNLQPYEKHLAEKLQQVPMPDREQGWVEMRRLLDRELPEGGSPWSGNKRWWWMGLTAGIIITTVWLSQEFGKQKAGTAIAQEMKSVKQPSSANATAFPEGERGKNTNQTTSTIDQHATQKGSVNNSAITPNAAGKNIHSANEDLNQAGKDETDGRNLGTTKNTNDHKSTADRNRSSLTEKPAENLITKRDVQNQSASSTRFDKVTTPNERHRYISANVAPHGQKRGKPSHTRRDNTPTYRQKYPENHTGLNDAEALTVSKEEQERRKLFNEMKNDEQAVSNLEERRAAISSIPSIKVLDELMKNPEEEFDEVSCSATPVMAIVGKTDKAFAKEMRRKSIKEDRRRISGSSMRGKSDEKDHDLTFAAGLSLPQSFAISGQQASSYGVNGTPGKLSDYLPVPFFQYHFNDKVFLQTELHFQSPQYTSRLLVFQDQQMLNQSATIYQRDIYLEKLYYFHIPFSVYLSPIRNFYIGSGLQYSSLLSGVASYETKRYSAGTLENSQTRVIGFKDDSVAAKLSPNEWRYQFDANYYFRRFTFGLRYNQAMKQFINLQPGTNLPFTEGRNRSFLLYLRYNIWEERKR